MAEISGRAKIISDLVGKIQSVECWRDDHLHDVLDRVISVCEQAARDAVARQAFAAVCEHCEQMTWLEWEHTRQRYYHTNEWYDPPQSFECDAHHLRLALDPDGRLACAQGRGDAK